MRFRAYLVETMTGQVGPEVDLSAASADIQLNGIEQITATLSRASLDGVDRRWWSPWAGGLLVTVQDEWTDEMPLAAGPIVQPVSQDLRAGTVSVEARGIGAVLEHRVVLDQDYRPGGEAELRRSVCDWSGVDLGSIVGRIVTAATAKRSGWLPIVVPVERQARRQRTFEGWNLANNGAWKRITEITEVIGGPDVMLRPRWADDARTRVEWVLVTGLEGQPGIPQDREVLWDTTTLDSPIASVDVVSDAAGLANRVYATGAGEGAGTVVAIAEQLVIPDRMPLLESVVTDSDTENTSVLVEKARSGLVSQALDQVSVQVASTEVSPVGSWLVGDLVRVVTDRWLQVPDGEHLLRVIAAKWQAGSELVSVELQPDVLGEEMAW